MPSRPCLFIVALLAGCARPPAEPVAPSQPEAAPTTAGQETTVKLTLTSPAFREGGSIPSEYTCEGADHSPELSWTPGPAGTVSYALIMDDPDAPRGTWVHWVVWNITGTKLAAAASQQADLGVGASQGTNSWGKTGWGGPCPPSGTHRYVFKVYALDTTLSLPSSTTKDALLAAMQGHVLAQGELVGRYAKRQR